MKQNSPSLLVSSILFALSSLSHIFFIFMMYLHFIPILWRTSKTTKRNCWLLLRLVVEFSCLAACFEIMAVFFSVLVLYSSLSFFIWSHNVWYCQYYMCLFSSVLWLSINQDSTAEDTYAFNLFCVHIKWSWCGFGAELYTLFWGLLLNIPRVIKIPCKFSFMGFLIVF